MPVRDSGLYPFGIASYARSKECVAALKLYTKNLLIAYRSGYAAEAKAA